MPIPLVLAAAGIGAAGNLAGNIYNAHQTKKNNEKQREHEIDMYNREQAGNKDFWNLQNAYNHPIQQMNRLEAAGMNPAMMYGSGSAANTSGPISAASPKASRSVAPQLDLSAISTFAGQALSAKQFELSEKATDADVNQKNANAVKALTDAEGQTIDNSTRQEMNTKKMDLLRTQIDNTGQRTETEKMRAWVMSAQESNIIQKTEIDKAMSEVNIEKAKAQIAKIVADTEFYGAKKAQMNAYINSSNWKAFSEEFDLYMRRAGVNKNDPFYWKYLGAAFKAMGDEISGKESTPFQPMPLVK